MSLDSVELNKGSGGAKIGVDNIGNVDYEVVKAAYGDAGSVTMVSPTNPLPVSGTVAVSNLPATQPVSGTVSVGNFPATQPISGTISTKELPDNSGTFSPLNATSSAYENSRVAKASGGVLYSITGFNSNSSAQFIQVHNTASVPADTAVPVLILFVAGNSNFSISYDKLARFFSTGITICNSSTGPTKTIGVADCWFDILYF
jgi:hypothetical protein